MSVDLTLSVAVGVFGALVAFSMCAAAFLGVKKRLGTLFLPDERNAIYLRLTVFGVWAMAVAFLSLDFRKAAEPFQYAAIGLSGISVWAAIGVIALNFGAKSDFGKWREQSPSPLSAFAVSMDEHRRQGIAGDTRRTLWSFLALVIGIGSAVVVGRLVAFRYEGHWFSWLLS